MKKYINNVSTLEELKSVYKRLALKHHPDCGGDEEVMKAINNEYDELFETLKNKHMNKDGEYFEKETEETSSEWRDIIHQLLSLRMENVVIEVIGCFLWVSGDTRPYRKELGREGLGMKWSRNKTAWYMSPKNYRRYGKRDFEMDEIRDMYGSQKVGKKNKQKAITA